MGPVTEDQVLTDPLYVFLGNLRLAGAQEPLWNKPFLFYISCINVCAVAQGERGR